MSKQGNVRSLVLWITTVVWVLCLATFAAAEEKKAPAMPAPVQFLSLAARDVQVTQFQDGTLSATVGGSFLNAWVARINPDGSLSLGCVENSAQIEALLSSGSETAAYELE